MNRAGSRISKRFRKGHDETQLQQALDKCRRSAREGYRIAKDNLDEIKGDIDEVSEDLEQHLTSLSNGKIQTTDIKSQTQKQLQQVVSEFYSLHGNSLTLLKKKHAQLDKFSIVLFGRTMSGKSTLMEILTNGDGSSIGKGGQRTTRDVRRYEWKGLEVTDVPGIAAFEGRDDEDRAFEAAEQSDLVLFLVTDDAPQDAEAECLARVRSLGKPILGICNVKTALNNAADRLLFLRRNWFDHKRRDLDAIVRQFYEFAEKYNPGRRIRFVYTHLQSKFLSQQPEYKSQQNELKHASRFGYVEKQIISEVVGRGTFLRWKSFIDGAVVPMLEFSEKLLDFSAQNSSSGRVLIDKHRQVKSWSDGFRKSGQERIDTFIKKEMNSLRAKVPGFAEDNYEAHDAGKRWNRLVKNQGIEQKAKKLVEQIQNECKDELSEIARQLKSELNFVGKFAGDRRISMNSIFNTKRSWNWTTNIISGGLATAAVILASGPLGWAAAGVGLLGRFLSGFFEDREEKARKQRYKLESELKRNVSKIERNLRKKLDDWFHQELLERQVDVFLNEHQMVISNALKLADKQRDLAWRVNKQQKELHRTLLNEALEQLGHRNNGDLILDIARVPGLAIMLLIAPKTTFPEDVRKGLEKLLGEKVWFVIDTGNKTSILAQAIGHDCDRSKVRIESKTQIAHVPVGHLDAVGISRIQLAQQLTKIQIFNKNGSILRETKISALRTQDTYATNARKHINQDAVDSQHREKREYMNIESAIRWKKTWENKGYTVTRRGNVLYLKDGSQDAVDSQHREKREYMNIESAIRWKKTWENKGYTVTRRGNVLYLKKVGM